MTPDLTALVGEWFDEYVAVAPDMIVCDDDGNNMYDDGGNVIYVDDRLFGMNFRKSFFCATGKFDSRLVLSTNKRVAPTARTIGGIGAIGMSLT